MLADAHLSTASHNAGHRDEDGLGAMTRMLATMEYFAVRASAIATSQLSYVNSQRRLSWVVGAGMGSQDTRRLLHIWSQPEGAGVLQDQTGAGHEPGRQELGAHRGLPPHRRPI